MLRCRSLHTTFTRSNIPCITCRGLRLNAVSERSDTDILISRQGKDNFAGKWQAKGDFYISFENLKYLDEELTKFKENRSKNEKKTLLSELTLTYFARFHNLIRSEYQYEKSLVDERLKTWSTARLRQEGFTLFDLVPVPRGVLFQDKVFRFKTRTDSPLPFHRFSVGDSVRLSVSKSGNPLNEAAVFLLYIIISCYFIR